METLRHLMETTAGSSVQSCELPEDYVLRSAKMRVDTLNALEEPPRGYQCPICHNKGYVAFLREEPMYRYCVATRDCQCMPIRRTLRRMERSGLGNALTECTFEAFQADKPWQKALKEAVQRYAQEPEGWLTLLGQPGSGKTHLCTAACGALLSQGREVTYMSWQQEAGKIKSAEFDQREAMLEDLRSAEVLYIDDLFKAGRDINGAIKPTQTDVNLAFSLLNSRYAGKKATILSSELTMPELIALDEALASRIVERSGENLCVITPDREKNYRLCGRQKRF